MKIRFIKSYKSIRSLSTVELPDFTVLTGVNGAGKSHLLEAMESGSIEVDGIIQNLHTPAGPNGHSIRRFDSSNIVAGDTGAFSPAQITQERGSVWKELSQHQQEFLPNLLAAVQHLPYEISKLSPRQLIGLTRQDLETFGIPAPDTEKIHSAIAQAATNASNNIAARFTQNDPANRSVITSHFREKSFSFVAMEADDFYGNFPKSWMPVDLFQQSFGRLFADYQRGWRENQLKELGKSRGEVISFLSQEEFVIANGEAPWDFVNRVFETAGLSFRINEPHRYEDRPYEPMLTDVQTKTQVKFADLSSGEKVLMSFALCLYYAQDGRQRVNFPKVLLFDEIDSPLHPSMTQSLLRTIETVLVGQYGIKVVLTTHSPSTVALAPESSLYAMQKEGPNRLGQISKDRALTLLTAGVPTLSVNYENRRQVFVESRYDVGYYDKVYGQLRGQLEPEISLNFIASGIGGQGNCDQVKDIVKRLTEGGNKTVFGVVDWDQKNVPDHRIRVMGHGLRYGIENYLLDPVLVAALLLREKLVSKEQVGLPELANFTQLAFLDSSRLQVASDFVVRAAAEKVEPTALLEVARANYAGGQTVDIPNWYLQMQGHKLETVLKEAFPQLLRYRAEPDLKNAIADKVTDDCPTLIPSDFVRLFTEIQRASTLGDS